MMSMQQIQENPEKKKHSPLPWKPQRFEQGIFAAANGRIVLQVLSNGPVAEVLANISYVDRALNNHDALVAALKDSARVMQAVSMEISRGVAGAASVSEVAEVLDTAARAALSASQEPSQK